MDAHKKTPSIRYSLTPLDLSKDPSTSHSLGSVFSHGLISGLAGRLPGHVAQASPTAAYAHSSNARASQMQAAPTKNAGFSQTQPYLGPYDVRNTPQYIPQPPQFRMDLAGPSREDVQRYYPAAVATIAGRDDSMAGTFPAASVGNTYDSIVTTNAQLQHSITALQRTQHACQSHQHLIQADHNNLRAAIGQQQLRVKAQMDRLDYLRLTDNQRQVSQTEFMTALIEQSRFMNDANAILNESNRRIAELERHLRIQTPSRPEYPPTPPEGPRVPPNSPARYITPEKPIYVPGSRPGLVRLHIAPPATSSGGIATPNVLDDVFSEDDRAPALPMVVQPMCTPGSLDQATYKMPIQDLFTLVAHKVEQFAATYLTGCEMASPSKYKYRETDALYNKCKLHVGSLPAAKLMLATSELKKMLYTGTLMSMIHNHVLDTSLLDLFRSSYAQAYASAWQREKATTANPIDANDYSRRDALAKERSDLANKIVYNHRGFHKWLAATAHERTTEFMKVLRPIILVDNHNAAAREMEDTMHESYRLAARKLCERNYFVFEFFNQTVTFHHPTMVHRNPELAGAQMDKAPSQYVCLCTVVPGMIEKSFGDDRCVRDIKHKMEVFLGKRERHLRT